MNRILYVAVTLLLLAGAAAAQVCHAPIVHAPVVHHQAAVAVVKVVKELVAVPVLIPAYGAVYTPPVVPASPPPQAVAPADLKAIADSLRAIDARLRSLEGKPAPATPTPSAPPPPPAGEQPRPADPFNPGTAAPQAQTQPAAGNALAIVTAKCAQCHAGDASKGGGLVLVENGVLAKLADRAGRKAIGTVYRGTMPPKASGIAPLTDEEVSVLVSHYGQ